MERRSPFFLATLYVGIFAITGALFLNAAATWATIPGESGEAFAKTGLWLFAAAGAAFLTGLVVEAARAGWLFWIDPQSEETPGES